MQLFIGNPLVKMELQTHWRAVETVTLLLRPLSIWRWVHTAFIIFVIQYNWYQQTIIFTWLVWTAVTYNNGLFPSVWFGIWIFKVAMFTRKLPLVTWKTNNQLRYLDKHEEKTPADLNGPCCKAKKLQDTELTFNFLFKEPTFWSSVLIRNTCWRFGMKGRIGHGFICLSFSLPFSPY